MPEEGPGEKEALDLGGEALSEGVEKDEELLLAKDLVSLLIKAIKAFRFYPSDNPTLKGFQEELPKKFQLFLDRYQSFVLQISEFSFSFKEKVLYEDRDVKRSLAFIFYRDGLRELRFMKGLEKWEIYGFIDVISRSGNMNQLEDDFVTLMWEKDFIHIGYLATDEFLNETPILVPESVGQFKKGLASQPLEHEVDTDLSEEKEGLAMSPAMPADEIHPFVSDPSTYSLTAEDVERLQKEVEFETSPTFVFNVVDTVFEIMALEKEQEPYQDAVNMLGKVLDAYLSLSEFKEAGNLLRRVYILLKTPGLKPWQVEILQKLILGAGEERRIERIGRAVENEEGIRLEDLSGYLLLLQRNSVKPLIKLLGEWKKSRTRRVVCDALSDIGKNAVETFGSYIEDSRWYLVRNITYILGRIGKEEALPYLQKAFHHAESRVRREAVQALGLIGGAEAVGLLVKALTDEESQIRAMGALSLGRAGRKAGLAPLLEIVQSKDFLKRESSEIRAFFDSIGMIGSDESIPVLRQMLERKSWFGRGRSDEVYLAVAQTLAAIGTPEAVAILESGRKSKEESIRQACIRALRGSPNPT